MNLEHQYFLGLNCLMQISTHTKNLVINMLELHGAIVKVFHSANSDTQWLQKDFSNLGCHLWTTLLQVYCNVESNKQLQLADWRIWPLL